MNYFANRYKKLGIDVDELLKIKPRQFIRVNTLKIGEKQLIERLKKQDVELKKIDFLDHGYEVVSSRFSVGASPEYLLGYYYIQEAASQCSVQVLQPKKHELVLDMCAAPGGKTTQIAQYMENTGAVVALDNNHKRLLSLNNNLERCGISNTVVYKKDARFISDFGLEFDKILLDAPCSGNFVVDDKWFLKRQQEDVRANVKTQRELLKDAVKVCKKGGIIVYSTCSLEPEENEMNISWLLGKYDNLELLDTNLETGDPGLTDVFDDKLNSEIKKCRRFWPHKTQTQAFFIAKIKKKE